MKEDAQLLAIQATDNHNLKHPLQVVIQGIQPTTKIRDKTITDTQTIRLNHIQMQVQIEAIATQIHTISCARIVMVSLYLESIAETLALHKNHTITAVAIQTHLSQFTSMNEDKAAVM